MHEKRNFILILILGVLVIWTGWAWFYASGDGFTFMRSASTALLLAVAGFLTYGLTIEDHLPGHSCGSMQIDWIGNAMKTGAHPVDEAIELKNPVILHLAMPKNVTTQTKERCVKNF